MMGKDDVILDLAPRFLWGLIGNTWYVVCMSVETLIPYQDDTLKLRLWMGRDQLETFEKCRSFALHRVDGERRGDKYRVDDICAMFSNGIEVRRLDPDEKMGQINTMVEVILTGQNISHLLDSRNWPRGEWWNHGQRDPKTVKLVGAPDWLSEEDRARFRK